MLGAVLAIPLNPIKGLVIPRFENNDESICLYIVSKGEIRLEIIPQLIRS